MNADDFGLSAGVNRAVLDCFHGGILRSTSLMPNGSAFDDAVRLAHQTPGLGVGIHVSLVGERCVAPPSLLGGLADDEGRLPASYTAFARGLFSRRFSLEHVRLEMEAQVERFGSSGLRATHLDSHQHVHLLPGVFPLALEAAKGANIRVVRVPAERLPLHPTTRSVQLHVLTFLARRARRLAQRQGFRVASHFWGLDVSGHLDEAALLGLLSRCGSGVNEIMAHPGYGDEALRAKYDWGYDWDGEAKALQSARVRKWVGERGLRLAHLGEASIATPSSERT